jgi:hypothetical protein
VIYSVIFTGIFNGAANLSTTLESSGEYKGVLTAGASPIDSAVTSAIDSIVSETRGRGEIELARLAKGFDDCHVIIGNNGEAVFALSSRLAEVRDDSVE